MIIGSKKIFFKKLTSTNSYAGQLLIKDDPPEGTVIYTDFQTAGKGQLGNKWESEECKNLTFSIILYPIMIIASEQFLISMTLSLGIYDFLKSHRGNYAIKWPNDIYANDDKIAGILIEHAVMGNKIKRTIAGIGININQVKFLSNAPNPVSLKMITGIDYDLNHALDELLSCLDKRYKQLLAGDFDQIKNDYTKNLYRLKEWHNYKDSNGVSKGRIISVTEEGRLQVENSAGKTTNYSFKEIDFML